MSVALSFIGGTGSFAFLEMICVLKKWFSFWLAVGFRSFAPLIIGSAHYPLTLRTNENQSQ